MSPTEAAGRDTWGNLVRNNRLRLGLSQEKLGQMVGVSLKTINRHEKQGVKPDTYELAEAIVRVLGIDPEVGLRAAGYGPQRTVADLPDPYAHVREMGLDPHNSVVQRILGIPNISDEMRYFLLKREREFQLRDERRRIEELDTIIELQRRRDAG